MGVVQQSPTCYRFGPYTLAPSEHLLTRNGVPLPLAPKAFDLLHCLVAADGHLLSRDELMQRIWPDSFVEETNLTVNISLLRKLLGDFAEGRPYIETIPRKGYRFQAGVVELCTGTLPLPPDAAHRDPAQPLPAQPNPSEPLPSQASPASPGQPPQPNPSTPDPFALEAPAPPPTPPLSHSPSKAGDQAPAHAHVPAHAPRWPKRAGLLLALACLLVLAPLALLLRRSSRSEDGSVKAGTAALAVLPFHSLKPEPGDEYLGLGMTDALITRLGALRHVVVRPIATVRRFEAADDPIAAGRALSADEVLEGTVQKASDRTRVTVRLLRVADGATLWSATLDEPAADVFSVEDAISERVASALSVTLSPPEQERLSRPSTSSAEAYQDYLKGRYLWNKRTADGVRGSIEAFQQAVRLDPRFALAYAGLADAYILAGSYGYSILPPREAMPRARAAAEKALSYDEALPEAHTSIAYIRFTYDWDWNGAEREFRRAIALNPGYDTAHHWYSHELIALGRPAEAMAEARLALSISPTDVVMNEHLGWTQLMMRDYSSAIESCDNALRIDPSFLLAHRVLARAWQYSGRSSEALAEAEKGVALSHGDPVAQAYLAQAWAVTGSADKARAILDRLTQDASHEYVPDTELAAVEASLGHKDAALRLLEKAYTERAAPLVYIKVDRAYDSLRSQPGFTDLLRRLNL